LCAGTKRSDQIFTKAYSKRLLVRPPPGSLAVSIAEFLLVPISRATVTEIAKEPEYGSLNTA
jgi:hypothetical protein